MRQIIVASLILAARILVGRTCFGKLIRWIRAGHNPDLTGAWNN